MRNYRDARTEDEKSDSRLTGPEASRCWECALKTNIRFEGKGAFLLAFLFREACPGKTEPSAQIILLVILLIFLLIFLL